MRNNLPRLSSVLILLFGIFLLVLLLVNGTVAMDGVRRGFLLCTETLLPSLFPFLVLSDLLVSLHAGDTLCRLVGPAFRKVFGLSGQGATALLLGILCGFPIGAITAVSLWKKRQISREELLRLLLFANIPSSGFLVGAVGGAMFGNRGAGMFLYFSALLSAVLCGIFLRIAQGRVSDSNLLFSYTSTDRFTLSTFSESIRKSLFTFLQICSFVLFFSCITACLALPSFSLPAYVTVSLTGLLEMTSGISAALTSFSPAIAFRFCAFFAGFSGLSVCLQIFSVSEEAKPAFTPYFVSKTVQGLLCLLFSEGYLRLAKPDFLTARSVMLENTCSVSPFSFIFPVCVLGLTLFLFLPPLHRVFRSVGHS